MCYPNVFFYPPAKLTTTTTTTTRPQAKLAVRGVVDGLKEKVMDLASRTIATGVGGGGGTVVTPAAKKSKKGSSSSPVPVPVPPPEAGSARAVTVDSEYAFGLALQQLRVLGKRMDLPNLLGGGSDTLVFVKAAMEAAGRRVGTAPEQEVSGGQ